MDVLIRYKFRSQTGTVRINSAASVEDLRRLIISSLRLSPGGLTKVADFNEYSLHDNKASIINPTLRVGDLDPFTTYELVCSDACASSVMPNTVLAAMPSASVTRPSSSDDIRDSMVWEFDTCWLIALRVLCDGSRCSSIGTLRKETLLRAMSIDHSTLCKLRDLRFYYHKIEKSSDTELKEKMPLFLDVFRSVWSICERLDPLHPLHLPTFYSADDTLHDTKRRFVRAIALREARCNVFQTGHATVFGERGRGKTTLIKAFAVAIAVCSPRFFLIHADYGDERRRQEWTPPHVFRELYYRMMYARVDGRFGELDVSYYSRRAYPESETTGAWVSKLRGRCGLRVGIAADNLQKCAAKAGSALLSNLEHFARNYLSAWLIISGTPSELFPVLTPRALRDGVVWSFVFKRSMWDPTYLSAEPPTHRALRFAGFVYLLGDKVPSVDPHPRVTGDFDVCATSSLHTDTAAASCELPRPALRCTVDKTNCGLSDAEVHMSRSELLEMIVLRKSVHRMVSYKLRSEPTSKSTAVHLDAIHSISLSAEGRALFESAPLDVTISLLLAGLGVDTASAIAHIFLRNP